MQMGCVYFPFLGLCLTGISPGSKAILFFYIFISLKTSQVIVAFFNLKS